MTKDGIQPTHAFCCSPKTSIIISILRIKGWAQEEEMCPGSLIFQAENKFQTQPEGGCYVSDMLHFFQTWNFWLTIKVWKSVLVKVYGEHKEERPEQNTHTINVSCHHHYSKCYDFLYNCLKNKQNLPAKLVWTTLQKSVLEKEYGFTVSTKCQMDFNSEAIKWCHKIAQLFSS